MEEIPCPAREGKLECCYASGHEERSGMGHRFVIPNHMLPESDAFEEFMADVLNGDVVDDVEERMRRAWRETNRIDNGEDDE